MLRRSLLRFQQHRYTHATFHDGTHRQAPGDSTPWRDVSSPINYFKAWWLAPAAKGSIVAAWSICIVLGVYCGALQQDAKRTYLINTVLLRDLHSETLRADSNAERLSQYESAAVQSFKEEEKGGKRKKSTVSVTNYEAELCRERARSELVHERNEALVAELAKERKISSALLIEKKQLTDELMQYKRLHKNT